MSLQVSILIVSGALICEFIDASMGMLYGTILSPVLIIAGFEPVVVVPAILFSQALGGFTASIFHHRLKNVNLAVKSTNPRVIIKKLSELGYIESFKRGTTKDFKVSMCVAGLGVISTVIAVLIAINISKSALKTYIGILVVVMGAILLFGPELKFSWKKMLAVGILSAFNKGISGGGFGPVVTSGQLIAGRDGKSSIGATTFAEAPIRISGFLTFLIIKGISNWNLVILLSAGALIGAPFGALLTSKFKSEKHLRSGLGLLTLALGIWILIKTWVL